MHDMRILIAATLAAAAALPATASAESLVTKAGTLEGSVETVTLANGSVTRGPAPAVFAFAPGAPVDHWLAYPADAVAIDTVADLPASPFYDGGGRLERHQTRDLASGVTRMRSSQEIRGQGVVVHTEEECRGPADPERDCTSRTWTTPLTTTSRAVKRSVKRGARTTARTRRSAAR